MKKRQKYSQPIIEVFLVDYGVALALSAKVDDISYELQEGGNASDSDCPPLDTKESTWDLDQSF